MSRGVSSGGGKSSLSYLFGNDETPKPALESDPKPNTTPQPVDVSKQIPAGIHSSTANNSVRADGQSTFITDRTSTKVHAAPGGGSSLGYLFGGGGSK